MSEGSSAPCGSTAIFQNVRSWGPGLSLTEPVMTRRRATRSIRRSGLGYCTTGMRSRWDGLSCRRQAAYFWAGSSAISDPAKGTFCLTVTSITEVIYCFEKFTIGKDKVLLAEVLEQGGDRNIGLRIPETFIIEARKL